MTEIKKIKKILAAVDLGPDTERVLSYALWLSGVAGAPAPETALLYVIDYALTPPAYLQTYMEKEREREEQELAVWEERLKGLGARTSRRIALGRLVETFHSSLEQTGADVMVLGHKSHLIRPSSSERLIKALPVPMLVVRGERAENASLGSVSVKKILCATDFSDYSRKAMAAALSLAKASSAEITAVHVVSSRAVQQAMHDDHPDAELCRRELIREAEERMDTFLKEYGDVEGIVKLGEPYQGINDAAKEGKADLVVVGARGLSYVQGVLLGSVSESVVKSSPCPVMIIH